MDQVSFETENLVPSECSSFSGVDFSLSTLWKGHVGQSARVRFSLGNVLIEGLSMSLLRVFQVPFPYFTSVSGTPTP